MIDFWVAAADAGLGATLSLLSSRDFSWATILRVAILSGFADCLLGGWCCALLLTGIHRMMGLEVVRGDDAVRAAGGIG